MFIFEVIIRSIIILILFYFSRSVILSLPSSLIRTIFPKSDSLFSIFRFLFLAVTFLVIGEYFIYEEMPNNYLLSRMLSLLIMILMTLILYSTSLVIFHDHNYLFLTIALFVSIVTGQYIGYLTQRRRRIKGGWTFSFFSYFFLTILLMVLTLFPGQGFIFN